MYHYLTKTIYRYLTLKMASTRIDEASVANDSPFQNYWTITQYELGVWSFYNHFHNIIMITSDCLVYRMKFQKVHLRDETFSVTLKLPMDSKMHSLGILNPVLSIPLR